jgi:hypothetical protein
MNNKVMSLEGLPAVMAIIVAMAGLVMIGSLIPVAYAADKTEEIWQRVIR